MDKRIILIVLWTLCTIGMILHFNYHVGEIFYGIDIERPNANGIVPVGVFIIRSVFYHIPFVWILLIIYKKSTFWRLALFLISILYALAHFGHFLGEVLNESPSISQLSLLFTVLMTALILVCEHFNYWKQNQKTV